jgi:hypothetical protein
MRLATWNCQTGLDTNWSAIEDLKADVITVQECGEGTEAQASEWDGWTCEWQPGGWEKGLAVIARPPYRISEREESETFAVSTVIDGPSRFRFIGFWAMTPSHAKYTYTRQATRLIERLDADDLPTVIAGDFNASKSAPHLTNVTGLNELGLVSAYHASHGIDHDAAEPDPTSYFQWNEARPFHMDFVFVPRTWEIDAVELGTFDKYTAGGLSDHVPVVASVTPRETI